jgi:Carboxypeptidase regulatory-like domain
MLPISHRFVFPMGSIRSKALLSLALVPALATAVLAEVPSAPAVVQRDAPRIAQAAGTLVIIVRSAADHKPLAGVRVTVTSADPAVSPLVKTTASDGVLRFGSLAPGRFKVEMSCRGYEGDTATLQVKADKPFTYRTELDRKGETQVIEVREDRLLVNSHSTNGSSTTRSTADVRTAASTNALAALASTVAGVQTNSQGQVHVRGEHKGIGVEVDGVSLPALPESALTQVVDPRLMDSFELQTGSFDASAGGQTGAIQKLSSGGGKPVKPYAELTPTVGTYGTLGTLIKAGGSDKDGHLTVQVGASYNATDNQYEPVTPRDQTLGNHGTNSSALVRVGLKEEDDQLGFTVSNTQGRFGVSQNAYNQAAGVVQTQDESNLVGAFSWKHAIGTDKTFGLGLSYLKFRQHYTNNGIYTPFVGADPSRFPDLAAQGLPADPTTMGSPYLPDARLDISQFSPSAQLDVRLGDENRLKLGADMSFIRSIQQVNVLDAGGGGALPNPAGLATAPTSFSADTRRNARSEGLYFDHAVPLVKDGILLDYGVRADRWDDGLGYTTGQISPRLNLAFPLGDTRVLRASYNRLFQPPPLEIDASGQSRALPQRTDAWELSYEMQPAKDVTAKVALVDKWFHDQLDVGLLILRSNVPLYAPVNFGLARYKGVELAVSTQRKQGLNTFLTATYGSARPLRGENVGDDLPSYNDHDQRVQVSTGGSYTFANGVVATLDGTYGSGFPQDYLQLYNAAGLTPYGLHGSRLPRFVANFSLDCTPKDAQGKPTGAPGVVLTVQNLFDSRSVLNFLSDFSGTRFVQGRRVLLQGVFRF